MKRAKMERTKMEKRQVVVVVEWLEERVVEWLEERVVVVVVERQVVVVVERLSIKKAEV